MIMPATGRTSSTQAAAVANSRKARELVRIAFREPVAQAANGLDHVGWDFLAQPPDEHLDGIGVAIKILLIKMLDQLGARDDAIVMVHQVGEQPILVRGKLDRLAVKRDASGFGVEPQRSAFDVAPGVTRGTADLGAEAGQQLFHVKRFGHVVVGAGVHPGNLVAPTIAGGQDDDGHVAAGTAPLLEHADAVDLGQTGVKNDDVVGLGLAEKEALLAVEGGIDGVTGIGQRRNQLAIEIAVIFEDQYAHDCLTLVLCAPPTVCDQLQGLRATVTPPGPFCALARAPWASLGWPLPRQYKGFQACASIPRPGVRRSPVASPTNRPGLRHRPDMGKQGLPDGGGWPAAPVLAARPPEAAVHPASLPGLPRIVSRR